MARKVIFKKLKRIDRENPVRISLHHRVDRYAIIEVQDTSYPNETWKVINVKKNLKSAKSYTASLFKRITPHTMFWYCYIYDAKENALFYPNWRK